jgi:hypothetical protein
VIARTTQEAVVVNLQGLNWAESRHREPAGGQACSGDLTDRRLLPLGELNVKSAMIASCSSTASSLAASVSERRRRARGRVVDFEIKAQGGSPPGRAGYRLGIP